MFNSKAKKILRSLKKLFSKHTARNLLMEMEKDLLNLSYRIRVCNDIMKIITKDKTIKLTLLNKEGGGVSSEIFVEVYIHKKRDGYDVPQYMGGQPDHEFYVDTFHFGDIVIWGSKEWVETPDEEFLEEAHWYFDFNEEEL